MHNKDKRFIEKDEKERYELICLYTWGSIPSDKDWAKISPIYKQKEKELIEKGELWVAD